MSSDPEKKLLPPRPYFNESGSIYSINPRLPTAMLIANLVGYGAFMLYIIFASHGESYGAGLDIVFFGLILLLFIATCSFIGFFSLIKNWKLYGIDGTRKRSFTLAGLSLCVGLPVVMYFYIIISSFLTNPPTP